MLLWEFGGAKTEMKIEIWDSFGRTGKMLQITWNSGLITNENNQKVLQKSGLGPVEISNEKAVEMQQMYADDVSNQTDNLYQLICSEFSEKNPKVEIILGDDPALDKDGILIDQSLNPQIDV